MGYEKSHSGSGATVAVVVVIVLLLVIGGFAVLGFGAWFFMRREAVERAQMVQARAAEAQMTAEENRARAAEMEARAQARLTDSRATAAADGETSSRAAGGETTAAARERLIRISMDAEGGVWIKDSSSGANGGVQIEDRPAEPESVAERLRELKAAGPGPVRVTIEAAPDCPFRYVAAVHSACKKAGISQIQFQLRAAEEKAAAGAESP